MPYTSPTAPVHTRLLPEHVVAGHRLGRHEEFDEASKAYAVENEFTPEQAAAAAAILWPRQAPILDQGNIGSCTGNALTGALACRPGVTAALAAGYTEPFALTRYERATHLDRFAGAYPPDDTGSSGLGVCKAAKVDGLLAGYSHALTVNGVVLALQRGPVITGVPWFEGFDSPDASGLISIAGDVRGGHEFVIRGVQPATAGGPLDGSALLWCDNSWSAGWGDAGSMRMTLDTWAALRAQGADLTVPKFLPA